MAEVLDDLTYEALCPYGHNIVSTLAHQKFEILFECGLVALIDGYTREAVGNFVASYERFHEFCIRVFMKKKAISQEQFDKTWCFVKNQSERQLGSFYFLFLSELGSSPPNTIERNSTERNNVIHKGKLCRSEEAKKYAEDIFNYIKQILQQLNNTCKNEVENIIHEDNCSRQAKIGIASSTNWNSIFSLPSSEKTTEKLTFQEALDTCRNNRPYRKIC